MVHRLLSVSILDIRKMVSGKFVPTNLVKSNYISLLIINLKKFLNALHFLVLSVMQSLQRVLNIGGWGKPKYKEIEAKESDWG